MAEVENNNLIAEVECLIRNVPDFPKPGINFKDITPVLSRPAVFRKIVEFFATGAGDGVDAVIGVESRGFLFGTMLAEKLNVPFIPVRKQGKLPYKTISHAYDLEYGQAVVEMHHDVLKSGERVLIHDDLLATGGTAVAAAKLAEMMGATVVGFCFVIELEYLKGREKLLPISSNIISIVNYK